MNELLFATGNKGKADEARKMLGVSIEIADIEIDEVQSMDLEYISRKKAQAAFDVLKRPVITDDVGLFIDAWNGFPGPFAKFVLETIGVKGLLGLLKNETNRNVLVKSAVSYHDGNEVHVFIGEVQGTLATESRGEEGFGFDPIIIPNGETRTYAEMGLDGKNKLSHRRRAFDKLRDFLDSQETQKEV